VVTALAAVICLMVPQASTVMVFPAAIVCAAGGVTIIIVSF